MIRILQNYLTSELWKIFWSLVILVYTASPTQCTRLVEMTGARRMLFTMMMVTVIHTVRTVSNVVNNLTKPTSSTEPVPSNKTLLTNLNIKGKRNFNII